MALRGSTRSSRSRFARKDDLSTIEGLQRVIKEAGYELPKKKTPFSGVKKAIGVLNAPIAAISGFTQGLINKDINPLRQAGSNVMKGLRGEEFRGFSDVIKEESALRGKEVDTRSEKVGAAALGLGLDIFLDPTTYLTFGMSGATKLWKVGGKTLTKGGQKVAERAMIEAAEATTKKATRELLESVAKKTVTREVKERALKAGVSPENILALTGKNIVDEGELSSLVELSLKEIRLLNLFQDEQQKN